MLLGGLIGFAIGVGFGLAYHSPWPDIIWRASVAAFLAGTALRWWGKVWIKSLYDARRERQQKAMNAANN